MNNDGEELEFDLPADHGDLVTVDGYEGRLFMVIAYQLIRNCLPETAFNEIVYEVIDAYNGEYLEVDGEDVEFVTDAGQADEYIRANPEPTEWRADVMNFARQIDEYEKGLKAMAKEPRKPTARELSAQLAKEQKEMRKKRGEQIDNLLDLRNWAADMLAKTGNEEFGDRVFALDAELKKLVETE
jgi:hypothetical protein